MNETIGIDRSAPLAEGTQLKGGDYRIISTLGRGGFGVTYLAEQTGMQRKVCIKEFFPKDYYRRDEDTSRVVLEADSFGPMMARFKEKFLKEARTIARFKHPNIIAIYDIFEENDTAYYVMEYIEGHSLKSLIAAHGPLAEDAAVGYITQVASALDYVHSRNTVHLDVKPDNIMLSDEDGSALLIDFGLSKHYDGAGEQTSTTPVGISRGYAPMEQYQTSGVNTFRPATDIYSLGATLYTLVTGTVPPEASVVNDEGLPTLPKSLSAGVRAAIERAMQSRTKDRPQSIAEFMQLLNGNNTGGVVPPKKPTVPKKRGKWWLWLLLLAIVGGGVFAYLNSQPKDNPEPPDKSMTIVPDTIKEVDSVEVVAPIDELEPEPTPAPDTVLRLTSDNSVTLSHGGGNGTIRYSVDNPVSGVNLSVSYDASWLTTSRSGNTISYSASANESQSSRTATITVSYGDQSFEVAITQSGKPAPAPTPAPEPTPAPSQPTAPAPSPTQSRSNYTESGGGYGISMKMVWVEGGTFQMGSTNGASYEQPVHPVTLSGYWIAETEVTQAQWEAVMGTTVRQQRDLADSSLSLYGVGPNNPMYYVSYTEAMEFCRRLSSATGKRYTLPTEAQWEYAALGGQRANGTIFTYSGSNAIGNVAWYNENSSRQTHPVKSKQNGANQLGLYDMSGNVWELCLDWYSSSYYSSSPQNNPQGPSSGQERVLRGGSWLDYASDCRVANRGGGTPSRRYYDSGFRVVCLP